MPATMCINCTVEYKTVRQGVTVIEMFNDPPIPHAIWNADMQQCGCGRIIIAGYGANPVALHYQPDFQEKLDKLLANPKVITLELHERGNASLLHDRGGIDYENRREEEEAT